ncbi:glutamate ABC transporter substrate-binding protein [Streptomyces sp. URMC 123]|uniref:glutamate ABC transporter substrate-binding protein n=1 Tax=Streptomyces sp. URMC 123 TaxID=3423403 RepID=UPI003F1A06C8
MSEEGRETGVANSRGRRLRGWGGVATMAAGVLVATALVPAVRSEAARDPGSVRPWALPEQQVTRTPGQSQAQGQGEGQGQARGTGEGQPSGQGTAQAQQAADDSCGNPEASLRPSTDSGPAVERIRARGHLIAGVDQNSYRWGYRDPATGDLAGFDIDLVRAIARNLLGSPDKVVFRAIPTNQRIPALKAGTVDVVVRTMTINCKRKQDVAFSTAYFQAGQQVLAPRGSTITAFDRTLAGRTVCTAKGSTGEAELARQSHGAKVTTVPNQLDCLVRLQLGTVDAVVTDNALAAGQAAQDPAVRLVGTPFTKEPYGVAMNQADTDLVRRVNHVLEEFRAGGADSPWMRAYRTWLAADLKDISGPPAPVYQD